MADTVVVDSYELKLDLGFEDGDNRALSIPNPPSDITAAAIHSASQTIKTNHFVVGDKAGSPTIGILTADKVHTKKTKVDLS